MTSNERDIHATGKKGDLLVSFGYGQKTGSSRRQPVMVIRHAHAKSAGELVIYMDDAWAWDASDPATAPRAMLNAMRAAERLYNTAVPDSQHVHRVLDAVHEWTQDLLRKDPMPMLTHADVVSMFERDRLVVKANGKTLVDAR